MTTVEDLMTQKVVSVHPETALIDAVNILTKYSFSGLPVIDDIGRLKGLLTERSMIAEGSYMHLKTLLRLFSEVNFYKKDRNHPIRKDLEKILSMKVSDVLDPHPTTISPQAYVENAAILFADPKVNPIPVVDGQNKLVGILSLSDLTKLYGVNLRTNFKTREIDKQIDNFIEDFEHQFVVVSKRNTRLWFITSIMFTIVGFVIAFLLILRLT
ncbi:MAG: hypothetical protein A3H72_02405 [Candidatus Doudnabacteria bacterium RIFCSPLOWO2_02_FULL_48_8]|uniref:CBS domain-containing protein n=1 Tax=Candidatus Doudnabacteria bacterium RIFCSPHIGHO2_01_FULL_46_24 TaxID=1817825 RepID=A0A1F5NSZ3_9BACT|nr:MAG: hypothetical protein A2720_04325 [Candidatus Doudnabacteria bacterium RIFCSPHIGHO2_01_FULL_46_24]OGE94126.1 MAG: hypothetical protein A3E98_02625 [Candidatus Doudnabacteria bacterium RIFCSPHIGHO2_12_FULL_48_11]OGE95738.1 MAG: hypothetical protein A3H72_02405 [Candidatus Doudnabacteria bacterium RIFCSPLOWO2_02_FULL_48_8]